jgi:nitronate monooxygenase
MLDHLDPALQPLWQRSGLLLPIVQGGMGVGVSAHRLAGSVAARARWARCRRSTCAATTPT